MADILDLVESRKHLFSDALRDADNLLNAHFFARKKPALMPDLTVTESTEFEEFLRSALV